METRALQNSFDTVDMKAMPEQAGKLTNPLEEFCAHQRREQVWKELENNLEHPISGVCLSVAQIVTSLAWGVVRK